MLQVLMGEKMMKKWSCENRLSHLPEDNPPTLKWLEHFYNFHTTYGKSPLSQLILKYNLFPGSLPTVLNLPVLIVWRFLCVYLSLRLDTKRKSFCSSLGSWSPGKVGQEVLLGDFFFHFLLCTSNREYYNDLQRHAESKLCCKRLSLGPAKNHRKKMQKVWNSQQQRLTGKYGFVFLWVKVTFMLCFPMRNYKLSKEF